MATPAVFKLDAQDGEYEVMIYRKNPNTKAETVYEKMTVTKHTTMAKLKLLILAKKELGDLQDAVVIRYNGHMQGDNLLVGNKTPLEWQINVATTPIAECATDEMLEKHTAKELLEHIERLGFKCSKTASKKELKGIILGGGGGKIPIIIKTLTGEMLKFMVKANDVIDLAMLPGSSSASGATSSETAQKQEQQEDNEPEQQEQQEDTQGFNVIVEKGEETIIVAVKATDTISILKAKIQDKNGTQPNKQLLTFMTKKLKKMEATLVEIGIGKDAKIQLTEF